MASAGLACCALEVEAAVRGGLIVPDDRADRPRHTVLLVSGTVTDVLAPAIVGTKADAANHKSASQVARNLMTTTIQSFDPTYSTLDANIGAGSGQSYTIEGFTRSLQNALIKARL